MNDAIVHKPSPPKLRLSYEGCQCSSEMTNAMQVEKQHLTQLLINELQRIVGKPKRSGSCKMN